MLGKKICRGSIRPCFHRCPKGNFTIVKKLSTIYATPISMLRKDVEKAQMITKKTTEDANVIIVNTDISLAMSGAYDSVFVNGGVNNLVLVTALTLDNAYFRRTVDGNCLMFSDLTSASQ